MLPSRPSVRAGRSCSASRWAVRFRCGSAPTILYSGVLALAPWLPEQLDLSPLEGKRLAIVHGTLDGPLPGIPGVTAKSSRHAYERAVAQGIDASYTLVRGGLHHGAAVPLSLGPNGGPAASPGVARRDRDELARFEEGGR